MVTKSSPRDERMAPGKGLQMDGGAFFPGDGGRKTYIIKVINWIFLGSLFTGVKHNIFHAFMQNAQNGSDLIFFCLLIFSSSSLGSHRTHTELERL